MLRKAMIPFFALALACSEKSISGDAELDGADPSPDEGEQDCTEPPGCEGRDIVACGEVVGWCDPGRGEACLDGECVTGCEHVDLIGNNLGCEFWAADLDNAMISSTLDASSQKYAVVVGNPGTEDASITVERSDAAVGAAPDVAVALEMTLAAGEMTELDLERREVDGSTLLGLDDGTGTALTANAYHILSTRPIVAYQFNPLENTGMFSSDASLLVPAHGLGTSYAVLGWPQTVSSTPTDPDIDMGDDLRAFVTVIGTRPSTHVHVELGAAALGALGDGDTIPAMGPGDALDVVLGAFEVLNIESDRFMSDFTGTLVTADGPIAVFSGSEASDVPTFETLASRLCCSDHLEHQIYPVGSQGRTFVAALTPMRTAAVLEAGGDVTVPTEGEREFFRILAIEDGTTVTTTLDPPDATFVLDAGEFRTLETRTDFLVESDGPVSVGQFVAGQGATGMESDFPGGDPSFIVLTPESGWRRTYQFAVPPGYGFDFVIMAHAAGAAIRLDGAPLPEYCEGLDVEGTGHAVTRCQLSFPVVMNGATPPDNILPGEQGDGMHEVTSDTEMGVIVYGFDNFISYGYSAGAGTQ